jgi:N-acetylmuramoyl-L-alanine amidase
MVFLAHPPRPVFSCSRRRAVLQGAAVVAALILSSQASVAKVRTRLHLDEWEQAVELRQQLESSAAGQRTREQYEAVLDAFRLIYHQNPTAAKAPAAVAAVADLLAEKGRVLTDQRALRAAIGQYEFLRQQYSKSPQIDNALLLEGEICRQDLKDTACAEEKFRAVIAEEPDSSFAEQAAMELKELEPPAPSAPKNSAKSAKNARSKTPASATQNADANSVSPRSNQKTFAPETAAEVDALQAIPPPEPERQSGPQHVVMITGMRHWSNPTSTRIAIDLGGKVEYEAARVPNPERIFFDLHGAKLAPSLNGHQVEVVDDGYLKRIRAAQFHPDVTRVVLDVTDVSQYSAFLLPNPWRLIIDIHSAKGGAAADLASSKAATGVTPQPVGRSGTGDTIADVARLSNDVAKVPATAGPTSGPVSARVPGTTPAPDTTTGPVVTEAFPSGQTSDGSVSGSSGTKSRKKSRSGSTSLAAEADAVPALPHAADPTADGQRSLVRALGLKVGRIVIDAGHGGHDSGTLGPGGIQEKDVVLDVALRVGKLLHQRLGAEIVYTRSDDTFIPLETRTAIANKAQADLFLSIHGNSSPEPSARGVETYYLNFTSDPDALDVAARENAVSTQSVHQLSDLVRKITLKDKIDESREFAADVDAGLYAGLKTGNPGLRDRGVKKAPFVVLIGAQMPSILAEISFLTNPDDADELRQGSYRQRIAEALDAGVEQYLRGLSGTRPVEKAKSAAKNAANGSEEPAGQ